MSKRKSRVPRRKVRAKSGKKSSPGIGASEKLKTLLTLLTGAAVPLFLFFAGTSDPDIQLVESGPWEVSERVYDIEPGLSSVVPVQVQISPVFKNQGFRSGFVDSIEASVADFMKEGMALFLKFSRDQSLPIDIRRLQRTRIGFREEKAVDATFFVRIPGAIIASEERLRITLLMYDNLKREVAEACLVIRATQEKALPQEIKVVSYGLESDLTFGACIPPLRVSDEGATPPKAPKPKAPPTARSAPDHRPTGPGRPNGTV